MNTTPGSNMLMRIKDAYQSHYGPAGREWIKYLANHQQEAVEAVRAAEERWRSLVPSDYGEQVHRVAARFAVLECLWHESVCTIAL